MLRWLISHGRLDEAEKIIRGIAEFNGKPLPADWKLHHVHDPNSDKQIKGKGVLGFLELFKTPNLRMKTLIIYYMWFSTSLVYYGLTLNSNAEGALFEAFCLGKCKRRLNQA